MKCNLNEWQSKNKIINDNNYDYWAALIVFVLEMKIPNFLF